jgi:hypothetical protein
MEILAGEQWQQGAFRRGRRRTVPADQKDGESNLRIHDNAERRACRR